MSTPIRTVLVLALALPLAGCGAAGPVAATPTLTAASPSSTDAGAIDRVLVVPRPARSIARLRTLLRSAPAASSPVEHALGALQPFDLEEPILYVERNGAKVTSFGISRETASRMRGTGGADKCDAFEVAGKPRIACEVGVDALTDEGRALGAVAPPPARSDLHMEMTAGALARELGKKGEAAAIAPLLAPLGAITIDVSLEGTPEVRVAFGIQDAKDGVTGAVLEAPVAPPPATFLRLPGDAEIAAFAHAPAAADMAKAREILGAAIADAAASDCSVEERRAARAEIDKIFFTGGSLAFAVGFDRARAEAAANANDAKKLKAAERAWAVLGLDEPADKWRTSVTWLATHGCGAARNGKPNVTSGKPSARLGLPAGAIELVERGAKDGVTYTFVVPDGAARTWVAVGPDEAALAARVRTSLRGAPDATLAGRAGLGVLRGPATFGGFVTASGIAWLGASGHPEHVRTASALPTAGRTPIPFRGSVVKDGRAGTVATRVALEASALADLVALLGGSAEAEDGE